MKTFLSMTKRNIKLFFKDKGMFFTSLITPVILLVLYSTFLAKVYRDSFTSALPDGIVVSEKLIGGMVGGELFSSLLAVLFRFTHGSRQSERGQKRFLHFPDKKINARNILLYLISAHNSHHQFGRNFCKFCLYCNSRLVSFVWRCHADSS